jgi:hypothetical protein
LLNRVFKAHRSQGKWGIREKDSQWVLSLTGVIGKEDLRPYGVLKLAERSLGTYDEFTGNYLFILVISGHVEFFSGLFFLRDMFKKVVIINCNFCQRHCICELCNYVISKPLILYQ